MKQKILNTVSLLRLAESIQPCKLKDLQIDDFFKEMTDLGLTVDERQSGDIRHREVGCTDEEQGFEFSVAVIQTGKDDMIIIDADFNEEE
jgi:hypothetical protein